MTKSTLSFRYLYDETASSWTCLSALSWEFWLRGWWGLAFESFGFTFHMRGRCLGCFQFISEGCIVRLFIFKKSGRNTDKFPQNFIWRVTCLFYFLLRVFRYYMGLYKYSEWLYLRDLYYYFAHNISWIWKVKCWLYICLHIIWWFI